MSKNVTFVIYGWPLIDKYMVAHERLCEYIKANENEGLNLHCQCYGNFTVFVGDIFQGFCYRIPIKSQIKNWILDWQS